MVPVKFRPGRDRLCTIPRTTGSPLIANSTGLPVVARIARMAGPLEMIRSAGVPRMAGSIARRAAGITRRVSEREREVLSFHVAALRAFPPEKGRNEWVRLRLRRDPSNEPDAWKPAHVPQAATAVACCHNAGEETSRRLIRSPRRRGRAGWTRRRARAPWPF